LIDLKPSLAAASSRVLGVVLEQVQIAVLNGPGVITDLAWLSE
jgi:hypothetical protein